MIVYGCIVPHSPLFIQARGATKGALQAIAKDLVEHKVDALVSISSHPRFQRDGFSAYVSDRYEAHFRDLGDLTNEASFPVNLALFDLLRERRLLGAPILHPIDDGSLDFGHAIPLWLLSQEQCGAEDMPVLCINDMPSASQSERLSMGQALERVLEADQRRYAVIISAECAFIREDENVAYDAVKEQNIAMRHAFSSLCLRPDLNTPLPMPACANGAATIAQPCFNSGSWKCEELAFEHASPTSFFLAKIVAA